MLQQNVDTAPLAADPEYTVSQPRLQTMQGFRFFYVPGRTTMEGIQQKAGELIDRVSAIWGEKEQGMPGQLILSYGMPDESGTFDMLAGFPVPPGTEPIGEAQVQQVEEARCASVVYCGNLQHIGKGHEALMAFCEQRGLQYGAAFREWYLYGAENSLNNVILITYDLAG